MDLPQAEPNTCDTVVAAVRETHAHHVDTASRVLAVDTCLPQVLCEGAFFYEIVVVLVPANGDTDSAIVLHVFGHVGQSMQVQPWSGPLPAHVAELLKPGS